MTRGLAVGRFAAGEEALEGTAADANEKTVSELRGSHDKVFGVAGAAAAAESFEPPASRESSHGSSRGEADDENEEPERAERDESSACSHWCSTVMALPIAERTRRRSTTEEREKCDIVK